MKNSTNKNFNNSINEISNENVKFPCLFCSLTKPKVKIRKFDDLNNDIYSSIASVFYMKEYRLDIDEVLDRMVQIKIKKKLLLF